MQWNAGQDIGGKQYSVEVGDIILHEGSQSHIITTDGALREPVKNVLAEFVR